MEALLGSKSFPPGFRFHPTDEELFKFYLRRKVMGKTLGPQMISEVDVYQFAPWDLPPKACLKTRDLNWFFFCPRARKYPNGGRTNRATEYGFWKSTGNDRTVLSNHCPVGKIKTLIFHRGKAPKGERTNWVMHEYRLEDKVLADKGVSQDAYVICKIYEKSGLGPKNGEHYGAPFMEEEWESDEDENMGERGGGLVLHPEGFGGGGGGGAAAAASMPSMAEQRVCVAPMERLGGLVSHLEERGVADGENGSVITGAVSARIVVAAQTPCMAEQQACVSLSEERGVTDSQNGSVSAQNVVAASTPSTAGQPVFAASEPLPPIETEEDDIDRMLENFFDEAIGDNDIYRGLEDLAYQSSSNAVVSWSHLLSEQDGTYLEHGTYLELNDLLS